MGVVVHYLEYHMHGHLTTGSYLPPLWNQAKKKYGQYKHSNTLFR